jgi:ATP-dependent Clp protease ATP-binding subunit ClpC
MTSNVGAKAIVEEKSPLGFGTGSPYSEEQMRRRVLEELRATFRPEFLNRVDETIVFHRLGREELFQITGNLLEELRARFEGLGLRLEAPEETVRFLAERGSDPKSGARPLRRAVQSALEDRAAELLLSGKARAGDRITALVRDGQVALEVEREE